MSNICRLGHLNQQYLHKMKTEINIREYTEKDFEEVNLLWETVNMGGLARGDSKEIIQKTIDNNAKLFILEIDNKIIGTSWITSDYRRLYLHHFAISPEYQGKGYSKPLLEKTLKYAKEQGMQIKLEVHNTNKKAIKLYEKFGFKYLGDYDVYIIREINSI